MWLSEAAHRYLRREEKNEGERERSLNCMQSPTELQGEIRNFLN